MKTSMTIAGILTLATIVSGSVAVAGIKGDKFMRGGEPRPSFSELDTNGDGALSREELQAVGQLRFNKADQNGDGVLSSEELIARASQDVERRAAKMVERFDKDGDGALSQSELPQRKPRVEHFLRRVDANDDGVISQEEFDIAMALIDTMSRKHGRHGPKMDGHHGAQQD